MTHPDAAHCLHIVRSHARTFWLASHFLQPEKRRAAFALYAFCRVADDMVDLATGARAAEVPALLTDYRSRLGQALAGDPDGPVFRELARAVGALGHGARVVVGVDVGAVGVDAALRLVARIRAPELGARVVERKASRRGGNQLQDAGRGLRR